MDRDLYTLQVARDDAAASSNRDLVRLGRVRLLIHQDGDYAPVRPGGCRQLRQSIQYFFWLQNLLFIGTDICKQSNSVSTNNQIRIAPVLGLLRRGILRWIGGGDGL